MEISKDKMARISRKTQKKENWFFRKFFKFFNIFSRNSRIEKGLKNTEKNSKQKEKICTFFKKNSARFPRQKKRKVKEDEESNEVGSTLEQGDH